MEESRKSESVKKEKASFNHDCLSYLRNKFVELYEKRITPEEAWREIRCVLGGIIVFFPKGTQGSLGKRVMDSVKKGLTTRQIADKYGVSTNDVRQYKHYYKDKK